MIEHGCWFCRKPVEENDDYFFTFEWDCDVHISCVRSQFELGNPEAECIMQEVKYLKALARSEN